jgi:molybdopterin/thiamine biosynthesis adenylyltransferase
MENAAEQYGRVKGASWFSFLYKRDVMVLGQGGIGSWTALLLSRIGCNLYLYDHDTYEPHNMTGQLVRKKDIDKRKSDVAKELIADFSPDAVVEADGKYTEDSPASDIMICGFDNMAARKLAFTKWVDYVANEAPVKSKCFFIDGRLNAELLQVFCIPGDRQDLISKYHSEYLFDDTEVQEQDCTFKQTSHCAAMIASYMVTFLTNWVYNSETGKKIRQVPFFYQYSGPLNLSENVRE